MPVQRPRVLICGAGVAGPVLAYWLHRFGFRPTVIERTAQLRIGRRRPCRRPVRSGRRAHGLDGRAAARSSRPGRRREVIALVRSRADARSSCPPRWPARGCPSATSRSCGATWPRSCYEAARATGWSTCSTTRSAAVHDDGSRVEVTFERGAPRTFRPAGRRRRPAFDHPAARLRRRRSQFLRFLGGYLAVFTVHNFFTSRTACSASPSRDGRRRSTRWGTAARRGWCCCGARRARIDYDRHDLPGQRRLDPRRLCGDLGWEVPRLLGRAGPGRRPLPRLHQPGDHGRLDQGPGRAGRRRRLLPGTGGRRRHQPGDHRWLRAGHRTGQGRRRSPPGFACLPACDGPGGRAQPAIGPTTMNLVIPEHRCQIWLCGAGDARAAAPPRPGPPQADRLRRKRRAMLDEARLTPPDQLPRLG